MKTALKYLTIVGLAIAALIWPSFKVSSTEDTGEDVTAREAFRRLQLQDENGQIPPNGLIDAYKQKEGMPFLPEAWGEFSQGSGTVALGSEPGVLQDIDPGILVGSEPDAPGPNPWVSIGPFNIGGRIRAIIIHPTATPRILWVGAATGGVWKSIDDGVTWTTNTDFLANLGVRSLAIDPADPDTLYAGSSGIFKTTNGGNTWERLKSTNPADNPDFSVVNRLAICPTNSQHLLAATSPDNFSGKIYRSLDGGDTWTVTQTPATGANILDVRFQPNNGIAEPDVQAIKCVAGTGGNGVYYSNDGGATWTKATGLPANSGHVEVAYSRSSPAIVYASLTAEDGLLYRSINGGHHFESTGPGPGGHGTTAWVVANALWVDPFDHDTVLVGGVFLFRTTDHGGTWDQASSTDIHLDHQMIMEDPDYGEGTGSTRNRTVYGANDGGIHRTNNFLASPSVHWTSLNNNLAITQFYGAAGHVATGKIIGGTQDNGTVVSPAPPSLNWTIMQGSLGGDGGICAVDQTDEPYFYGENLLLQIYRSINGGDTKQYIYAGISDADHCDQETRCYANAIAPFILDPNDVTGGTMLAGGRRLWRSTNVRNLPPSEPSWTPIKDETQASGEFRNINAIAVAPGNSNIIWVGHNDGSVYYTTNGMDAHPTWVERDTGLPHGQGHVCNRITIGQAPSAEPPDVGRTVYVTFSGFNDNNVWKTQNNGQTWDLIHHSLPHAPIYSLVISPSNPNFLYVGTEVGVFASSDGGMTWSPSNGGPTNVPVRELFWMGPQLFAATHGRSIFKLGPQDN